MLYALCKDLSSDFFLIYIDRNEHEFSSKVSAICTNRKMSRLPITDPYLSIYQSRMNLRRFIVCCIVSVRNRILQTIISLIVVLVYITFIRNLIDKDANTKQTRQAATIYT